MGNFRFLEKLRILGKISKASVNVGIAQRFWSRFGFGGPSHHLYAQRGRIFGILEDYEVNTVYTGYK